MIILGHQRDNDETKPHTKFRDTKFFHIRDFFDFRSNPLSSTPPARARGCGRGCEGIDENNQDFELRLFLFLFRWSFMTFHIH